MYQLTNDSQEKQLSQSYETQIRKIEKSKAVSTIETEPVEGIRFEDFEIPFENQAFA